MAGCGETKQGLPHRLQLRRLSSEFGRPREGKRLDVTAGPVASLPEIEQRSDLLNREARIARAGAWWNAPMRLKCRTTYNATISSSNVGVSVTRQ